MRCLPLAARCSPTVKVKLSPSHVLRPHLLRLHVPPPPIFPLYPPPSLPLTKQNNSYQRGMCATLLPSSHKPKSSIARNTICRFPPPSPLRTPKKIHIQAATHTIQFQLQAPHLALQESKNGQKRQNSCALCFFPILSVLKKKNCQDSVYSGTWVDFVRVLEHLGGFIAYLWSATALTDGKIKKKDTLDCLMGHGASETKRKWLHAGVCWECEKRYWRMCGRLGDVRGIDRI
jgi:hypothetical protein